MSYKTLYRTYRPQQFKDVVGQDHITRTFMNALASDKISHAYLFTGPRGTGKTSMAKIIAKAANCEQAPTSEPCNSCPSCTNINTGFDSDVFEIDAASNNGVDEIREIRDKVKYAPTAGRYKIYIIDEVHMLSTGAFNALLKTLEEPPRHAIFILATTEPHKIPATIISRCQRFDFRSISVQDIVSRIKDIVNLEKIQIEEKAIITIAKTAQGGMRDALSLLDQVISYSDDYVTDEDVHEVAGTISEVKIVEIMEKLIEHEPAFAIEMVDELVSLGKEPLRLIESFIYYCRDLFLLKRMNTIDTTLIQNHSDETIKISEQLQSGQIYQMISKLNDIQYEMRKTNTPRVFLELAMFELDGLLHQQQIIETIHNTQPIKQVAQVQPSPEPIMNEPEATLEVEPTLTNLPIREEQKEDQPVKVKKPKKVEQEFEEKYIDAKEIEYVLNNGNKEKKLRLMQEWENMFGIHPDYAAIEQLLIDGQLEAVSVDNQLILSYELDYLCARLYEEKTYQTAVEILKNVFGETFSIIALPAHLWQAKREEFVEQFKMGIQEPKLTPITEPILIPKNNDRYEHEPAMVKEVISLFGDEIVEIID